MNPLVTMILVVDVEKDHSLTWAFLQALAKWNRRGMEKTQLLCITQKQCDRKTLRELSRQPFPVDVVHARHEFVDGYPLWDVCDSVRRAWGLVRGEWVTFCHQEFLLLPHRLERTCKFLQQYDPDIALGNLRRFVPDGGEYGNEHRLLGGSEKDVIIEKLRGRQTYDAAIYAEAIETGPWIYWESEPIPGPSGWREDIFFAKRAWLEEVGLFCLGNEQYFQDVYDLLGLAVHIQKKYGRGPQIERMDQGTHKALHLPHPRTFASFTPAIRAWFLSQPDRFDGTTYGRRDLWDLACEWVDGGAPDAAVKAFRGGRGGTVTRYAQALEGYAKIRKTAWPDGVTDES